MEEKYYKVVGMSAPKSLTLFEQNDHCWAKSGLTDEKYNQLFNWAKNDEGFWKQEITALVECDGFGVHGSPINGIVLSIDIK